MYLYIFKKECRYGFVCILKKACSDSSRGRNLILFIHHSVSGLIYRIWEFGSQTRERDS